MSKRAVFISGLGLVDNFMASDDLNECVEALLQKRMKSQVPNSSNSGTR